MGVALGERVGIAVGAAVGEYVGAAVGAAVGAPAHTRSVVVVGAASSNGVDPPQVLHSALENSCVVYTAPGVTTAVQADGPVAPTDRTHISAPPDAMLTN